MLTVLIGNAITVTATFANNNGPISPDTVRFRFIAPDGNSTTQIAAAVNAAATTTYLPTEPGPWTVRVETDNPDSAAEQHIRVHDSDLPTPS